MTAQTRDCFRFLGPIIDEFSSWHRYPETFSETPFAKNIRFHKCCLIQLYKRFRNVIYRYLHKIKPNDHTRVYFSILFGRGDNFSAPTLFKTTRKIMNCFFLLFYVSTLFKEKKKWIVFFRISHSLFTKFFKLALSNESHTFQILEKTK